jgi:hypothetical protein
MIKTHGLHVYHLLSYLLVTPCGSCMNRRSGGTYRLLHQVDRFGELGTTLAVTSNRCTLEVGVIEKKEIPRCGSRLINKWEVYKISWAELLYVFRWQHYNWKHPSQFPTCMNSCSNIYIYLQNVKNNICLCLITGIPARNAFGIGIYAIVLHPQYFHTRVPHVIDTFHQLQQ